MTRRTSLRIFLAAALFSLLLTSTAWCLGGQGSDIVGLWEVEEGDGRIEILRCGDKYCGRIAWQKEPNYPANDKGGMGGRPMVDRENPKKELRGRPQLGLRIMEGYTFRGDNSWDSGTIYNPESGKTYKSSLTLLSPDRLKLRAYIGISLIGGSTVWKRVPARI